MASSAAATAIDALLNDAAFAEHHAAFTPHSADGSGCLVPLGRNVIFLLNAHAGLLRRDIPLMRSCHFPIYRTILELPDEQQQKKPQVRHA
jgi:hypothetical protein